MKSGRVRSARAYSESAAPFRHRWPALRRRVHIQRGEGRALLDQASHVVELIEHSLGAALVLDHLIDDIGRVLAAVELTDRANLKTISQ